MSLYILYSQPQFCDTKDENSSIPTHTVAFLWSESAYLDYEKSFSVFLSCLESVSKLHQPLPNQDVSITHLQVLIDKLEAFAF